MVWHNRMFQKLRPLEGGYAATLEDYLDTFFDGEDPPLMQDLVSLM